MFGIYITRGDKKVKQKIYEELLEFLPKEKVFLDEPMSKHTTFRIGGNADVFVKGQSIEDILHIINYCRKTKTKIFVMGNGSNLLVSDNGIRGIVLKIDLKDIDVKDDIIEVSSGVLLPKLSNVALENGLTGLEFTCGIPGTVGRRN